jgi:ATP-binding cassette, subfamily B, bacterial MsbA
MRIFLRIVGYVRPYWKWLTLSILCTFVFSLFSGASIYLTIPLLQTLFSQSSSSGAAAVPAVSGSAQGSGMASAALPDSAITGWDVKAVKLRAEIFAAKMKNKINTFLSAGTTQDMLMRICVIILFVFLLKNLFDYLQSYTMAYVEQGSMMDIRNDLYEHLHNLSLSYFSNERTGNLISRVTNDVNVVNGGVSATFVTMLKQPLLIIVFLGMAFALSWKLTLLAFVVFPIILLLVSGIGLRLYKQSGLMQEKMADITSVLQETISNVKVVKAFAMEEFENNKFRRETRSYFRTILHVTRIRNLAGPSTELLSVIAGAAIIWYGGRQVLITGEMKPAEFLGFLFAIFQLMPPVKELSSVHNRMQEFAAAGKRIFEILDMKPEIHNAPDAVPLNGISREIEFRDVCFGYTSEENEPRQVLSHVNIRVKKGEVVAIVGPSGGGKTTMVDLIPRFYDPTDGAVLIDGVDIRKLDVRSLREQIGIVTQETILFNDSVRNNIAYGISKCPDDKIREAAKAANALAFIEAMPNGFETMIGDRGVKLSGGQRQRLSIARALLKNPPLMILDEATSALDSESEILVQEAIERLMQNRTSFVIAHRLSTIRNADRILVLEQGCIVQEGRHVELMKQTNGLYRKLHDMQFQSSQM